VEQFETGFGMLQPELQQYINSMEVWWVLEGFT
jgi:hypothetical protein